jgi:hypothetical protein
MSSIGKQESNQENYIRKSKMNAFPQEIIMPSTAKQVKTTALESIRAIPFTRVHGRTTHRNYKTLKEEASALASKVEDITYAWSKNVDNYGLLADILGTYEYNELTGINSYTIPCKPASYDPTITNAMLTHECKWKEVEWDLVRTSWLICKGFLRGVADNLCNALNEQYYSQLKHRLTAYRNITPHQILKHLNNRWCPLDVQAKKVLKKEYYTKWDADEHLTAFGKCLNDDQRALVRLDITIADDDKLQFYLEEIYDSNCFNKQEMLTWEQQPAATKTDYDLARTYFERIVKATDTYKQKVGGGMAGRNCYESANQLAKYGNKIREYIQQLASAGAANATDNAINVQMKEKLTTIESKIKKLTATIAPMATKMTNNENRDPNSGANGGGSSNRVSRQPQMKKIRNMGAYCSLQGFHPVGANHHNSATCRNEWRKLEHNIATTWTNCGGGDMFWPSAKRVAIEQQDHPTWKGKPPPTN